MLLTMILVLKLLTIPKIRNKRKENENHILDVVIAHEVRKLLEFNLEPQIYRPVA